MKNMGLIAVGIVRNDLKEPSLRHRDGDLEHDPGNRGTDPCDMISEIIVHQRFSDALDGIEDFSHIIVMFWTDCRVMDDLLVHPAGRRDLPLRGIFSTRSPARPNPVALTTVKLMERKGNVLVVMGLDAIDGTEVIDIKPHFPWYDAPDDPIVAPWVVEPFRRWRERTI